MEKVSVIIPCFNSARLIEESVLSVVQQVGFDLEIICVDNNSTDDTLAVLTELQSKYDCIIITSEPKKGASHARTKGLSIASGKYIQFLDSDDLLMPGKFKTQIEKIEALDLDWVISDRSVLNYNLTEVIEHHSYENFTKNPLGLAISEIITSGNPLYKRNVVLKVGGYTPNLIVGQDWDFHLKLILANTRFHYVPGDYFHSRSVEGSLSSNWFEVSKSLCSLIKKHKNSFTECGVLKNTKALIKIHQVYFYTAVSAANHTLRDKCIEELSFWSKEIPVKSSLQGKAKLLTSFFGTSNSIRIMRILSTKLN